LSKKIAVIGIGNTLRRDDGIGVTVLEFLLKFYKRQTIDYLNFASVSFDLVHRLKDYDTVLLIDGIAAGLAPAEVRIFELGQANYRLEDKLSSTHELDLKTLFELSKAMDLKTKIFIAGIQVEDVTYGENLSPVLEHKKTEIVKQINKFIDSLCFLR
jgi:hydrogenase maturation protease